MADLFAYGTLMCEDIMRSVSGMDLQRKNGVIRGFRRFTVKNEHYPAITEAEGGVVEGIVYCQVPATGWQRLDRFEGAMYERRVVVVDLVDGTTAAACTYVVRAEYRHLLGSEEWLFAEFLQRGKESFVHNYSGYEAIDR